MTEIKSAGEAELAAIMGKGQGKAPAAGIENNQYCYNDTKPLKNCAFP